jgi:hypothetical protein
MKEKSYITMSGSWTAVSHHREELEGGSARAKQDVVKQCRRHRTAISACNSAQRAVHLRRAWSRKAIIRCSKKQDMLSAILRCGSRRLNITVIFTAPIFNDRRRNSLLAMRRDDGDNLVSFLLSVIALLGQAEGKGESLCNYLCDIWGICTTLSSCPKNLLDWFANHTACNAPKTHHLGFIRAINGNKADLVPLRKSISILEFE